jgi:hypothetical protein
VQGMIKRSEREFYMTSDCNIVFIEVHSYIEF